MKIKTFLSKRSNVVLLLFLLVLIVGTSFSLWYATKLKGEIAALKGDIAMSPSGSADEEIAKVVDAVGKLMVLPPGETPTVATVADADKLKNQPFFTTAVNGDRVLIYSIAKKAILYRPSDHKIIDVAPVNIGSSSATFVPPATTPTVVRFALYNGTTVSGLTKRYEAALAGKVPGAAVVLRENASKQDHTESIIIDVAGTKKQEVEALATVLGIKVAVLPQGEKNPQDVDFLIILGSNTK